MKRVAYLVAAYLVFDIFHYLPPGSPQPADLIVAILIFMFLGRKWIKYEGGEQWLLLFLGYAYLINLIWSAILQKYLLLPPVYFTFNILAYALFKKYFEYDERNMRIAFWATLVALAVESVFAMRSSGSFRATGTFDNPNQLGYFAVSYTCLALSLAQRLRYRVRYFALALLLGWICSIFGLSKAGMGAMLFLTVVVAVRVKPAYSVAGLLSITGLVYFFFLDQVYKAIDRMNAIGEDKDDSAAGRGYDRIWNDVQYDFFGAGEGAYTRHHSVWAGEIHSMFGTLLFCYGVVGFTLFLMFLYYLYRRNRLHFALYLFPVFVYSLTHNGLRATQFWILMALIASRRSPVARQVPMRGVSVQPAALVPGTHPR